jgi:hypothetical protein
VRPQRLPTSVLSAVGAAADAELAADDGNAKQRLEFLDAKCIAIDAKLVANVQDLKQHAGSPMCLLTSRLTARLAVLLGTETVATIEVETRSTRMRGRSAPPPSATAPPASSTWTCTYHRMLARHKQLQ